MEKLQFIFAISCIMAALLAVFSCGYWVLLRPFRKDLQRRAATNEARKRDIERRAALMDSITDIDTNSNKPEYKFWGQDETDSEVKETETGFTITIKDLGVWHNE